jgi:hypothetical protein
VRHTLAAKQRLHGSQQACQSLWRLRYAAGGSGSASHETDSDDDHVEEVRGSSRSKRDVAPGVPSRELPSAAAARMSRPPRDAACLAGLCARPATAGHAALLAPYFSLTGLYYTCTLVKAAIAGDAVLAPYIQLHGGAVYCTMQSAWGLHRTYSCGGCCWPCCAERKSMADEHLGKRVSMHEDTATATARQKLDREARQSHPVALMACAHL